MPFDRYRTIPLARDKLEWFAVGINFPSQSSKYANHRLTDIEWPITVLIIHGQQFHCVLWMFADKRKHTFVSVVVFDRGVIAQSVGHCRFSFMVHFSFIKAIINSPSSLDLISL